jgi:hypothetical protein
MLRVSFNKYVRRFSLPCSRLGILLKNVTHIDIFVLDVDGGELEAIQTMDWTKTVDYWVVKLDGTNPQKDQAVRNLLISKGYVKSVWDMRSACTKRKDCNAHSSTAAFYVKRDASQYPVRRTVLHPYLLLLRSAMTFCY